VEVAQCVGVRLPLALAVTLTVKEGELLTELLVE
jgi:hypothetical protein